MAFGSQIDMDEVDARDPSKLLARPGWALL
jgi:hypothetical protein